MQSCPANDPKSIKTNDNMMEITQHATFRPCTITLKNSQHTEQFTDRKLMEYVGQKWKNKIRTELDIPCRFRHEKCLLRFFANDETIFEEMYSKDKWSDKIADNESDLKVSRIFSAAYSLVIQQFFNSWDIKNVLE